MNNDTEIKPWHWCIYLTIVIIVFCFFWYMMMIKPRMDKPPLRPLRPVDTRENKL